LRSPDFGQQDHDEDEHAESGEGKQEQLPGWGEPERPGSGDGLPFPAWTYLALANPPALAKALLIDCSVSLVRGGRKTVLRVI